MHPRVHYVIVPPHRWSWLRGHLLDRELHKEGAWTLLSRASLACSYGELPLIRIDTTDAAFVDVEGGLVSPM